MQPGRHKKPLELHVLDGKKHMGAEEKKRYQESEITMGAVKFKAPAAVKENHIALKKWKEITKIYKQAGFSFVTSSDNGVLGRYCLTYAEYLHLIDVRSELSGCNVDLKLSDLTESMDENQAKKSLKIVEILLSVDGIIKIDKAINAKLRALLDLEDRIFLNPVSKIRSIPVKKDSTTKKTPLEKAGFDV